MPYKHKDNFVGAFPIISPRTSGVFFSTFGVFTQLKMYETPTFASPQQNP